VARTCVQGVSPLLLLENRGLTPPARRSHFSTAPKLSQSAACAADLALRIAREGLSESLARPVWERPAVEPTEAFNPG
jgi:hypothetical protein